MKIYFYIFLFIFAFMAFSQEGVEKEKIENEIISIKKNIEMKVDLAQNYLKLGYLYSKLGDADKAQDAFENVIKLEPYNSKAYFMLGLIYEKKNMTAKAIDVWQKCYNYTQNTEIKQIAQKHIDYLRKQ